MKSVKSTGRVTGVLLLIHLALGLWAPFVLLQRLKGPGGFLAIAAANSGEVRTAVFLLFIGSAFAAVIAIAARPVLRRCSAGLAMSLFALGVAAFSLQAVDNSALLTMLSLSQQYATAGAAQAELFQTLAIAVGSARRWAHYTYLLSAVGWIVLFYVVLYRFRLVPRALTAVGIVAGLLQIIGVTLRGFLGYPPATSLAVPLAPAYIGLAAWLIVKGFDERRAVEAEAHARVAATTHS